MTDLPADIRPLLDRFHFDEARFDLVLCADPAQRAALFEALNAQDAVSNYELEVVRADGRPLA